MGGGICPPSGLSIAEGRYAAVAGNDLKAGELKGQASDIHAKNHDEAMAPYGYVACIGLNMAQIARMSGFNPAVLVSRFKVQYPDIILPSSSIARSGRSNALRPIRQHEVQPIS